MDANGSGDFMTATALGCIFICIYDLLQSVCENLGTRDGSCATRVIDKSALLSCRVLRGHKLTTADITRNLAIANRSCINSAQKQQQLIFRKTKFQGMKHGTLVVVATAGSIILGWNNFKWSFSRGENICDTLDGSSAAT